MASPTDDTNLRSLDESRMRLDSSTNMSLLASLIACDGESESWAIFIEKYRPLLTRWSRRWGADEHFAEDVTQETMVIMWRNLKDYRKVNDVPFRSWLKTVAFRTWLMLVRDQQRSSVFAGVDVMGIPCLKSLTGPSAREDLIAEFDRIATEEILDLAFLRVSKRVGEHAWKCFELTYRHKMSSKAVSESVGSSIPAVLMILSRVRKSLREEILHLDPPENE